MEFLKHILVPGTGFLTSKQVKDELKKISPSLVTHEEIKNYVADAKPNIKISRTTGGSAKHPHYKFHQLNLATANQLAERAELLLITITWEESQLACEHIIYTGCQGP